MKLNAPYRGRLPAAPEQATPDLARDSNQAMDTQGTYSQGDSIKAIPLASVNAPGTGPLAMETARPATPASNPGGNRSMTKPESPRPAKGFSEPGSASSIADPVEMIRRIDQRQRKVLDDLDRLNQRIVDIIELFNATRASEVCENAAIDSAA
jgi:hypothetical protein